MTRLSRTPRKVPAPPKPLPRGEMVAQVLAGAALGIGAVYAAVVVRRGPVVALVVLLIGASYLLRNWHRVKWVARGFLSSGLAALGAVLVVLLLGHDIL